LERSLDITEVRALVARRLPKRYEALQLTFYGEQCRPCGSYIVIGDDYGTELRIRLSDGAVLSIDTENTLPTRFVNSSVERFAESIDVHRSYDWRAADDTEVARLARKLREQLAGLDSAAINEPENWWAIVLEQVENGLL
jgi:hypothetical protein